MIQTEESSPIIRVYEANPFDELNASLRELAWDIENVRDVSLLVMEKSWEKESRWHQRLWDDWLERMDGGQGCWVESAEEELEVLDTPHPHVTIGS